MKRLLLSAVAAGMVSFAVGLPPASAAPAGIPVESSAPAQRPVTAPFDPICPLCFVREFLETFS
ncbi:hypothetical protein [Nocardia carnea]|uniref:hypothetical protein n=1 Tax=Nocardia carnea TaxID=37328 RepID=UPI0024555FCF|nr:hypothetical protein [Nocardia carnea]